MRRSKAEVDRYVSIVQSSSPHLKEKPIKGFLFAKLYFEAKEYGLAKRHVSEYLKVQERDPKAHKFLGQLFEKEGEINKAVGCYKRSVDLNPAQKDLVLKMAELLCSNEPCDSRAEYWVEKAGKLLPGHPAVFNLKEKLLSRQGRQGWNPLFDLLQAELAARPSDTHVNVKLVQLYCQDGRLDEAVKHCLAVEKRGLLRHSLDWYTVVQCTLQEYLAQPSVANNDKMSRRLQRELLLAHCNLLRLTLSGRGLQASLDALRSFDQAMQAQSSTAGSQSDELSEVFVEMKGHLYLHTATLLLKMAQEREQQWVTVVDLAALCYLLAYQAPRPKPKVSKEDQTSSQLVELLASDRQSQAGHMLFNLSTDIHTLVKDVVEAFGNRSGQGALFELLFGPQALTGTSFIANDDIRSLTSQSPEPPQLAKWDSGCIMLHGGDLQHLSWLALQWAIQGQRASLRDWLKQLFPRLSLETSKLDTNAPESICLLDLEVFVCDVVFCSQSQLHEKARINSGGPRQLYEPRCMPLPLLRLLSTDRQREWWDAAYSLIHKQALPGMSAKLRMIVQHGLSTLRAREKHGLQPALAIHWALHLSLTSDLKAVDAGSSEMKDSVGDDDNTTPEHKSSDPSSTVPAPSETGYFGEDSTENKDTSQPKAVDAESSEIGEDDNTTPEQKSSDLSSTVPAPSETGPIDGDGSKKKDKSALKAVDAGQSGMADSVGEDVNTTPEHKSSDPSSTVPAPSVTGSIDGDGSKNKDKGVAANSYYEQKEGVSRSDEVVLPLLDKVSSIPEPLDPLFIHFPSKDIEGIDDTLKELDQEESMLVKMWRRMRNRPLTNTSKRVHMAITETPQEMIVELNQDESKAVQYIQYSNVQDNASVELLDFCRPAVTETQEIVLNRIHDTLRELDEDEFKLFKWYLRQSCNLEGLKAMPKDSLTNADKMKTADLIVGAYPEKKVPIVINVLRMMKKEDLVRSF